MRTSPAAMVRYVIRPYRWFFIGILAATLLTSILEALNIAAFFPLFQSLLHAETAPGTSSRLFDLLKLAVSCMPFRDPLLSALSLLALITLARIGFQMVETTMVATVSGTIQHDLKNRLMRQYAEYPYVFFLENKQGQLIYNVSTASSRVGVLCQKIPELLAEGFKTAAVGWIFFTAMPKATGILILLGAGYFWLTRFLSAKVSYNIGKARVVASAEQTSISGEFFTGIRQIRSFGVEPAWLQKFREQSRIFKELSIRDAIWVALPKVLLELAALTLLLGGLFYLKLFHSERIVSILPLMGFFFIGLMRFLPSLSHIGQLRMEIVGLLGDAELLYQALNGPAIPTVSGKKVFRSLEQEIQLDHLNFSYPTRPVLFQDLQLRFEKGKTTALVGGSGGGKSTLAYLLLGLLEPTRGKVQVDGTDLSELDKKSWRNRIGFVPQDLFIAHTTILENITFGREGFSEADVRRAVETANAAQFIEALPQGFKTVVGERGMKLSGGQQQRIAIARAILHHPEILIFDEATSFLDTESEKLVQEALERIARDRTVILIAHRLSTVQNADRIVVLESGKVVEEGSHADLIREEGRYFQLATSQLK